MELMQVNMNIPQKIKDGVVQSLPIINDINDQDLRQKVIDAWALSLALNGYERIEEMPGNGMPGAPVKGDQSHHVLGVTYMAMAMKDCLEKVFNEPLGVDSDMLLACALCHDVGKPYEYNPENIKRWTEDPRESGKPALRHPAYGAYIALTVGLPEPAGGRSAPADLFARSSPTSTNQGRCAWSMSATRP